jgi:hypothetical protein
MKTASFPVIKPSKPASKPGQESKCRLRKRRNDMSNSVVTVEFMLLKGFA